MRPLRVVRPLATAQFAHTLRRHCLCNLFVFFNIFILCIFLCNLLLFLPLLILLGFCLLILFAFLRLVHPLSSSPSCTSSSFLFLTPPLTFLSPLLPLSLLPYLYPPPSLLL